MSILPSAVHTSEPTNDFVDSLSRELLVYTHQTSSASTIINLLDLFLANAASKRKIWNFNRLRCDIRVRISFVAPVYTTGIILAKYSPRANSLKNHHLFTLDGPIIDLGSKEDNYVFDIPYCHYLPFYDLTDYPLVKNNAHLSLATLITPTRTDDNSTVNVALRIYVSLQKVQLDVPVPVVYTSRKISKALTSVSLAAKSLSDIPFFGMYATAFSIGASAASSIAHLFGYSRPIEYPTDHTSHSSMLGEINANSGYLDSNSSTV